MKKTILLKKEDQEFVKKIIAIQKRIDAIKTKRLLLFGAGLHTEYMLDFFDLSHFTLRLCDNYKKGFLNGKEIEPVTDEILEWAETIIISGFCNRDNIFETLVSERGVPESKFVPLYQKSDTMPFYCGEAELSAEEVCAEADYNKDPYIAAFSPGSGERYEQSMEKEFFDAVMKKRFLKWISPDDCVLDVGAGTGRLTIELYKHGAKCFAVDTSKSMLDVLKKKNSNIETVLVNDEKLPFKNGFFDKVVSCEAMVHFKNWRDFMVEHIRVLKRGGMLIYNMYNDDHLKMISDNKTIRSNYMLQGAWCYATVTRKELEQFCSDLGNVELVEMTPIKFFGQTAYMYGLLTRSEIFDFRSFYEGMCHNAESRMVIQRFEDEIVQCLPEYMTSCNMVVFRKTD